MTMLYVMYENPCRRETDGTGRKDRGRKAGTRESGRGSVSLHAVGTC